MASMQRVLAQALASALGPEDLAKVLKKIEAATAENEYEGNVLTGMLQPSTAEMDGLEPITLSELQPHLKHYGTVIFLVIRNVWISRGMNMIVQDERGTTALLWSLIEYPCPGGQVAMLPDAIVAVKEPYFGSYLYGSNAITVQSPTDIEHIPRRAGIQGRVIRIYFDDLKEELSKPGDTAFASSKIMEAVDIYGEMIAQIRWIGAKNDDVGKTLLGLLLKRGFAYTRLGLHWKALMNFTEVLITDPSNVKALKQACMAYLKLGKLQGAQCYVTALKHFTPTDKDSQKIHARVATRLAQAAGEFDFKALVDAVKRGQLDLDVSTFIGDVEIRQSSLGGRGIFAKRTLEAGQLVICEKPIVVAYDDSSSFGNGRQADEKGVGGHWMGVLQQLATAAIADPFKARRLFDLYAGPLYGKDEGSLWTLKLGYDTAQAYKALTHDYHLISKGLASDEQKFFGDFGIGTATQLPRPSVHGIWYMTSMLNHSCLPNAQYAWIGDAMFVQALRPIEPGEELTVEYVTNSLPYDERKEKLSRFGFECSCKLCKAEAKLDEMVQLRKQLIAQMVVSNVDDQEKIASAVFHTYMHKRYQCLPSLELGYSLIYLAHKYLGPVQEWCKSSVELRTKATEALKFMLHFGNDIRLIEDPKSGYCDLLFTKDSQPNGCCITALMGLAEIAYLGNDDLKLKRAVTVLQAARMIYGMLYAETVTFGDHYWQYKCKALFHRIGTIPPPKDFEKVADELGDEPLYIPEFLRIAGREYSVRNVPNGAESW